MTKQEIFAILNCVYDKYSANGMNDLAISNAIAESEGTPSTTYRIKVLETVLEWLSERVALQTKAKVVAEQSLNSALKWCHIKYPIGVIDYLNSTETDYAIGEVWENDKCSGIVYYHGGRSWIRYENGKVLPINNPIE